MGTSIPAIEVTDHAYGPGIGRPDRKGDTRYASHDLGMGSQLFVGPQMGPLSEQVQIKVA